MSALFSPFTIKHTTLNSRLVLPPMANEASDESGAVNDKHLDFYVRRADVGMLIVEHSYVQLAGRVKYNQLGLHDDRLIPGLRRLVEAIKTRGAVVGIQLAHGGGKVVRAATGGIVVAPSAGVVPGGKEPAEALAHDQIALLVADYVAAAQRALAAGFDFVEIHGAHGYLLSQFLSPLTNQRDDEYGGNLAGRLRLPLDIVRAVRAAIGPDTPLLYRLGASDFLPGGLTVEEGCQSAKALAAAGVDLLDVSSGLCGAQPPDWNGKTEGYFVPLASAVRAAAGVPVIAVGGITHAQTADTFIREGQVDLVAVGRAFLKNPNWAVDAKQTLDKQS
jgi:2,4-dienoyl-CoA reductase-like NADH-dependent reductase (Old Yellow Enzyme family)